MEVKAKATGYYGLKRQRPGDVFVLEDPKHFSTLWMEKVGDAHQAEEPEKRGRGRKHQDKEI